MFKGLDELVRDQIMSMKHDNRSLRRGAERLVAVTLAWLSLVAIAAAQTPVPPKPDSVARLSDSGHLRGGWYPWDPYQYRDYKRGVPVLTGFDHGVENNQQFTHTSGQGDLFEFTLIQQTLIEGLNHGIMSNG